MPDSKISSVKFLTVSNLRLPSIKGLKFYGILSELTFPKYASI
jgi:hypothetical protein